MAGDWIKMRADLLEDPSVFRLAGLLDTDELTICGALFCFWAWADKHAVDGRVDGAASRLIDRVSHKEGFCAAMVQVGWLVLDDTGATIPNFDRHNGESAKERSLKNQRQARWREKKAAENVDVPPSTKASTPASTREEKRREEKREEPRTKERKVRLTAWLVSIGDDDPIADADPVFAWARSVGIPPEWIPLAWWAFENRYGEGGKDAAKTYTDWRAVFRSAVKEDWLRLWRKGRNGWELTTAGENVRLEMEAAP